MKKLFEKVRDCWHKLPFSQHLYRHRLLYCAVVVPAVILCIMLIVLLNMHFKYTKAIDGITEQIFQKMVSMEELFSYVDNENVDVRNKLIPQLKSQYTAALELNTALVNNFGSRYAVLSDEMITDFESAFKEYSDAISSGLSLNLARDDMAVLLAEVQDMVNARYNPTEKPTATPVIITES